MFIRNIALALLFDEIKGLNLVIINLLIKLTLNLLILINLIKEIKNN